MSEFWLETDLSKIELLKWEGLFIIDYYPRLKSFLAQKEPELTSIFSEPHRKQNKEGRSVIEWKVSTDLGFKSLDDSSIENEGGLNPGAAKKIKKLEHFISSLKSSTNHDERQWGDLLGTILRQLSTDGIFFRGDEVTIAPWGVRNVKEPNFVTYVENISDAEAKPSSYPPMKEVDSEAESIGIQKAIEDEIGQKEEQNKEADRTDEVKEVEPLEEKISTKKKSEINWHRPIIIGLLLLILGVLIFFFLKDEPGSGMSDGSSDALPQMPPQPGVRMAIDTNDIIEDEDSVRQIVSTRLVVWVTNDSYPLNDFFVALSQAYPEIGIKITFYDTVDNYVQIEVPKDQREELKKSIPLHPRLEKFDLIVLYESIMKTNASPSDPGFGNMNDSWHLKAIKAPEAWNTSFGDSSVKVAVVDFHFDMTHPEFSGRFSAQFDIPSNQPIIGMPAGDHGTHVAGLVGAKRDNGEGVSGVAPDCKLIVINVATDKGSAYTTDILNGVLKAIRMGAKVINCSFGMKLSSAVQYYPPEVQAMMAKTEFKEEERIWEIIYKKAISRGCLIVRAAGNENVYAGILPSNRSKLTLNVAAVDQNMRKADFSNYGKMTMVSAPGTEIYSPVPLNDYEYLSGTSMASPIVAGAAALVKSVNPGLGPLEIRNILINTARPVSNEIGPLIQLDRAVQAAVNPDYFEEQELSCRDVQAKIDSLRRVIADLEQSCNLLPPPDTLRIPESPDYHNYANGLWRSTTTLLKTSTEEEILIYLEIKDQAGHIYMIEPNRDQCSAPTIISYQNAAFSIDQLSVAVCENSTKPYQAYSIVCQPDENGQVVCYAQNKTIPANHFEFNLVKVRGNVYQ